jgi:hypothetical protein
MATQSNTGSKAFKGTLNYDNLRLDHQGQLKKLNDVLVETALSVEGLTYVLRNVDAKIANNDSLYVMRVPNKKAKSIPIRRNLASLRSKLGSDISSGQYVKSLVFIINVVEDYLSSNVVRILQAYPRKLLISTKGKELGPGATYAVEMRDLIDAGSLEAIIRQKAEQRTRDAMYASPIQYMAYFSSVTSIAVDEAVWASYAEIKATRDLYVHSDGTVNDVYIDKAATRARFSKGQKALVDSTYFDASASCMKHLMSDVYVGLRSVFSNSLELQRVFDAERASLQLASNTAAA